MRIPINKNQIFCFLGFKKEHSTCLDPFNIGLDDWRVDPRPLLNTQIPLQFNSYDCGMFICLYTSLSTYRDLSPLLKTILMTYVCGWYM